jgi:Flp pilus assembly protein protease CpaA
MIHYLNLLLFSVAMLFSAIASYFDMKTGEIPDKFTLGLVVAALAIRLIAAPIIGDFNYFLDGAIVAGIFFGIGAVLFYTGGWGGGDAKLLSGVGAALGGFMAPSIADASIGVFPAFFGFFIAICIVAIPYSLTYALFLSYKAPKVFSLTKQRIKQDWLVLVLALIASISLLIILKPWNFLLTMAFISPPIFFLLLLYVKSVEEIAMQKEIDLEDLQEGDMVVEDLVINGKKLASKRDMDGLSKEALERIKKSKNAPKKVKIKWGIKFGPAFPIALLVTPFWTSLVTLFF